MLRFIDARCMLGERCIIREGDPNTKEAILELMDRCHIEKAIVYHAMARESELPAGNMALIGETAGDDRFIRQWCALPSYFGEYMSAEDFFDAMKQHHVTSMRLLPKTCGYSLRPHSIGKLHLQKLRRLNQRHGLPSYRFFVPIIAYPLPLCKKKQSNI